MGIKVSLTGQEYDCLSRHVPESSLANRALTTAAVLSHSGAYGIYHGYEITCDETQAQALRRLAQHHCHSVVTKIDDGIKNAKPSRTTPSFSRPPWQPVDNRTSTMAQGLVIGLILDLEKLNKAHSC